MQETTDSAPIPIDWGKCLVTISLNVLKNDIVTNTLSAESLLLSKTYVRKHANKINRVPIENNAKLKAFNTFA